MEVTDYTDFTNINSSVEHRKKFNVGNIYMNVGQCNECGWNIRSKNRHDYVKCKCGKCAIDGGSHYIKCSGPITLHTVPYNIEITEEDED